MNYDPQDPKNYAFYRMYIEDDDDPPRRGPGCLTAPMLLFIVALCALIVAAVRR